MWRAGMQAARAGRDRNWRMGALAVCLIGLMPGIAVASEADVARALTTAPLDLRLRPAPRDGLFGIAPPAALPDRTPTANLRPSMRPPPHATAPRPRRRVTNACTADGSYCIAPARYTRDVCRVIEGVADDYGLDAGFFARLLWRESLFDPYAVSHAGALGIAQFIPSTAAMRGLEDPFNPAMALKASAAYLRDLTDSFGNPGLAAAAYNGGEARLNRFLDGEGGLPRETRAYVFAITGHPVETWVVAPPEEVDYALTPETPFQTACRDRAANRTMQEFRRPADLMPWAMIYAVHPVRDVAERRAALVEDRHADLLDGSDPQVVRLRLPGRPRAQWIAQTGHATQAEASTQCNRLRVAGAGCMVLRN
jgi:hypothetical protein